MRWTPGLLFATGWLSIVNSIGGFSLLFVMMRKNEAGKVASLFYLIPGVTAIMGYVVPGEAMSITALAGLR